MDENLECLYSYLMENKFVELNDRTEYITLKNMRDHAEKALMGDLSEEQRALFHRYLERESTVYSLEQQYLFSQAFSLGSRLSHS